MKQALKLISYIFHPIFIPLIGAIAYYQITPKYNPPEVEKGVLLSIFILTILIPIVFFYLLKNLGWIKSIFLEEVSERRIPYIANILLILMLLVRVIPGNFSPELYFFFVGVLGTMIASLILVFLKFKASMHMMGISGLTMFVIGLSVHYQVNLAYIISFLLLLNGAIASSRLSLKAHTPPELVVGFFLGFIPQFILLNYWL